MNLLIKDSVYFLGLTREPDLVRTEFSKEKTQLYMEQHVASGYLNEFKTQAENSGITDLLSIPIAIVLSCSLYNENKSLPKRTELVEKIIFKTIEKALKKSGVELPKDQIDNLLSMLGKLSWEALLKPSKQLLIRKVKRCTSIYWLTLILLEDMLHKIR